MNLPTVYTAKDIARHGTCDLKQPRIRFLLENMGSNKRVLDVGCFVGDYTQAFSDKGNHVVGIDASQEAINEARKRYKNIRFECVDAMELKKGLKKEKFDRIVASEVIEHVINSDIFLTEIYYILKKGGKLILTSQNSNGIQYRLRMLVGRFRWDSQHFRLYSKEELLAVVKKAGFKVEKSKVLPINPKGNHAPLRLLAYIAAKFYTNFGWTTAVVAVK